VVEGLLVVCARAPLLPWPGSAAATTTVPATGTFVQTSFTQTNVHIVNDITRFDFC